MGILGRQFGTRREEEEEEEGVPRLDRKGTERTDPVGNPRPVLSLAHAGERVRSGSPGTADWDVSHSGTAVRSR